MSPSRSTPDAAGIAPAAREGPVDEIAALTAANASLTLERDLAIRQLAQLRRSRSWRFTRPFRALGLLFRGDLPTVAHSFRASRDRLTERLSPANQRRVRYLGDRLAALVGLRMDSPANFAAMEAIVEERCRATRAAPPSDPLRAPRPAASPAIDISAVTFNSSRWIEPFVSSLIGLDYPPGLLTVTFVDNGSTDDTCAAVRKGVGRLEAAGVRAELRERPNRGYGAGHNAAHAGHTAPFVLVTNVDLEFDPAALAIVAAAASVDDRAAAWELRQKPYEHPKFYDPVTGATNWNSHACVLLRRSALERVAGYDETLFMYGEDVELSYRLRRDGHLLRYCPSAVVWHHSYEDTSRVKPTQYTGSTLGNLYLRLKYGRPADMMAVPMMAARLLLAREVYPRSRRDVRRQLGTLTSIAPTALRGRRKSSTAFPFRTWDYEIVREGAFIGVETLPAPPPLVSIITRTYRGRDLYLRQALLSVAHQTYPAVELIVVEDGGNTMAGLVREVTAATGLNAQYIALEKVGRSVAGNRALAAACGRWCVFLDDDDLLFADHVEVLVQTMLQHPGAVAAYSLAWEVATDTSALADGRYGEISHGVPTVHREPFDHATLRHHNLMAIQSVLFERSLYEERGGLDGDIHALEDWVLWNVYAHGHTFVHVPKVTSMYRTPADPALTTSRMQVLSEAYPLAVARAEARIAAMAE
jgi:GT2 family glycosyltransferase